LPVTFKSLTTGVCTVAGTTATFIGNGTCKIEADQSGNTTYAAAPAVTDSFTVNPIYALASSPASSAKVSKTAPGTAPINLQVEQPGHGFTGAVALSCAVTPLPSSGWKCPGLPTTVTLGSKTITIATGVLFPKETTSGSYTAVFTGTATSSSGIQTKSTASTTITVQ
jgi:hypothetical protein